MHSLGLWLALCMACVVCISPGDFHPNHIYLNAGIISKESMASRLDLNHNLLNHARESWQRGFNTPVHPIHMSNMTLQIVQFNPHVPRTTRFNLLANHDISVIEYVPMHAYMCHGSTVAFSQLEAHMTRYPQTIHQLEVYHAHLKIGMQLARYSAEPLVQTSSLYDAYPMSTHPRDDPMLAFDTVFVRLAPFSEDVTQWQMNWVSYMRTTLPKWKLSLASPEKAVIRMRSPSENDRVALIQWIFDTLIHDARVLFVDMKSIHQTQNYWSRGLAQSGNPSQTPIWDRGIHGEGEIIGCGDTGIDVDSCFFWDDTQNEISYDPDAPNLSHRKVVNYYPFADGSDSQNGHGTHVVGSILGSDLSTGSLFGNVTLNEFNGMAPNAKVAFFDIGDGDQPFLLLPDHLNDFLGVAYNASARIHSNSWGSGSNQYTIEAMEVDAFVYDHDDFLVLFAAGNAGGLGSASVGSPASCKNCLAVGAAQSVREAFDLAGFNYVVESDDPTLAGEHSVVQASFGPQLSEYAVGDSPFTNSSASTPFNHTLMVFADPLNACGSTGADGIVTNDVSGKIVWILRGECFFSSKVYAAQLAGAIGVIIGDNLPGAPFSMSGSDDSELISIPSMMMGYDSAVQFLAFTGTSTNITLGYSESTDYNTTNMAPFSSRGPTADGRIKPDIVMPGQIIWSAKSDGLPFSHQCGTNRSDSDYALLSMQGTSMATPLTAGSAALVRQYFREGFHVNGVKNISNAHEPSAALMRAMMLDSGTPMMGNAGYDPLSGELIELSVAPPPSMEIGFGLVHLNESLWFNETDWHLFIADNRSHTLEEGETFVQCIQVTERTKLTLTWTDPPAATESAATLVHDLDLQVIAHDSLGIIYPNNLNTFDHLNPSEQVILEESGTYTVSVLATRVSMAPQAFSLVIKGIFEELDTCPTLNSSFCANGGLFENGKCNCVSPWTGAQCNVQGCPNDCSNAGSCVIDTMGTYICQCNDGYFGFDCHIFQCRNETVLNEAEGTIQSHANAYSPPSNAECLWIIQPTDKLDSQTIQLQFPQFRLDGFTEILYVFDSLEFMTNPSAVPIHTLWGYETPDSIAIQSNVAAILFLTAPYTAPNTQFTMSYSLVTCPNNCGDHGECEDGICVCEDGYSGGACDLAMCKGFMLLTQESGTIEVFAPDENSGYTNGAYCVWEIAPEDKPDVIKLDFESLNIEYAFDCLEIWDKPPTLPLPPTPEYVEVDGVIVLTVPSAQCRAAGSVDGLVQVLSGPYQSPPKVNVNSERAYLQFTSDTSKRATGFKLEYNGHGRSLVTNAAVLIVGILAIGVFIGAPLVFIPYLRRRQQQRDNMAVSNQPPAPSVGIELAQPVSRQRQGPYHNADAGILPH